VVLGFAVRVYWYLCWSAGIGLTTGTGLGFGAGLTLPLPLTLGLPEAVVVPVLDETPVPESGYPFCY